MIHNDLRIELGMTHRFTWLKNGLYAHWYNRLCRILICSRGKCLCEFENGETCVTMLKALRRIV